MATSVETEPASAPVEQADVAVPVPLQQRVDRALRYAVPVATGLVAIGIVLRFVASSQMWLDEALTVNIARLPLGQIPGALRHDGAPPLYYYLLHFWMQAFGRGNFAVRAFSGLVSVATLPLAWLAGTRLGGRRMAWTALLLLASSPFAINYATTSRMYSMMIFWSLLGFLALARAIERPTIQRLVCVGALTAAVLYTHYWGLYLVGVTALWLLLRAKAPWLRRLATRRSAQFRAAAAVRAQTDPAAALQSGAVHESPEAARATAALHQSAMLHEPAAAAREAPAVQKAPIPEAPASPAVADHGAPAPALGTNEDPEDFARRASWSCFLAIAIGSLTFVPWVPSFVFQSMHTGTPWSNAAGLGDILTVLNQYAGGGPWGAALGLSLFALVLLGVFGESINGRHVLITLKARREANPIAFVFMGTLLLAVLGGTIAQAAFVGRYTAVVFPLFILLAALGVTAFADRRMLAVVLAWTTCAGLIVAMGAQVSPRTQAGQVATVINNYASPNDVVVYCPDQLGPAASRLITVAVRQYTFPRADPPERIDWVNYKQAISDTNVEQFADQMLSIAAGHDIWFVENPNYSGTENKCSSLMDWFSAKRNSQLWVSDNPNISLENESLFRFPE